MQETSSADGGLDVASRVQDPSPFLARVFYVKCFLIHLPSVARDEDHVRCTTCLCSVAWWWVSHASFDVSDAFPSTQKDGRGSRVSFARFVGLAIELSFAHVRLRMRRGRTRATKHVDTCFEQHQRWLRKGEWIPGKKDPQKPSPFPSGGGSLHLGRETREERDRRERREARSPGAGSTFSVGVGLRGIEIIALLIEIFSHEISMSEGREPTRGTATCTCCNPRLMDMQELGMYHGWKRGIVDRNLRTRLFNSKPMCVPRHEQRWERKRKRGATFTHANVLVEKVLLECSSRCATPPG